ncbi:MAG: chromophore lyase CpcT/CpeT [Chitinophagales bacterium]
MNIIKAFAVFCGLVLLLAACSTSKTAATTGSDKELDELVQLMQGRFTSEQQAKSDTDYFNISLIMTPIWTDRTDGKWLYVEQAVATKLEKPYRQRVYHLQHPSKNTFTSDIYTIKDALSFAGLHNDKSKSEKLTFDKIELKDGCTVTLTHKGDTYEGGTTSANCPSDLRGAKYATTKIVLKRGQLNSWDQGFDESGKQVWGATKGGYIFIKQ